MNPVSEQIDERILRLLGLEDVFDLDYDTYMTLLREAMVSGANKLPQEELALLANERKRIRGLEGRFKPEPRKITVDSISGVSAFISKPKSLPGVGILTLSQRVVDQQRERVQVSAPQEQVQVSAPQDQFVQLNETLSSILNTVNSLYEFEVKKAGEAALAEEKKSRASREKDVEDQANIPQKASDAFQKIVAPFQNILDKLFGFLKFIFFGKIFLQFVEWLKDPKNVEKMESLGRFLKDFWPVLLALYIKPFRSFVFKLTGELLKIAGRLGSKVLGPVFSRIGGFLARMMGRMNWLARVVPGLQTAYGVALGSYRLSQGDKVGAAFGFAQALPGPFGWIATGADFLRGLLGFNSGGLVSGEKGIDKVPAMLTEGEVVINKETVDAIGAEVFLALNRLYGGPNANKPKSMRFNTGGMVGEEDSLINAKALQIYNRLISKGLTSTAAMGIVSNIGVETGYTYDPSTLQGNNGPGRGLVQWEKGGRYDTDNINLVDFANRRKSRWDDMNTQVDFIVHELNTHPEYVKVRDMLNSARTVQDATIEFLTNYEKAGVAHLDRRLAVAEQLIKAIRKPKEESKPTSSKVKPKEETKPTSAKVKPKEEKTPTTVKTKPTEKPERWPIDPRGWFGMRKGGFIGDLTGMELFNPPNANDTQLIATEPGEYVIPQDTVSNIGKQFFDMLVAKTDMDSDASELIKSQVSRYTPPPRSTPGRGGIINLPPQVISSGQQSPSGSQGTLVPTMIASSPNGSEVRDFNARIYGIG